MPLYEVFSHSDRFHYRSSLCSWAACFLVLCTALTFLSPFLFAYFADGFWIKQATYSEQPRVNYSSRYLLFIDSSGQATNRFFISSYASINEYFRNSILSGSVSFSTIDNNNDGVVDQYSITFEVLFDSSSTNLVLNSIDLWLIFDYEIRARQYIRMETMTLINIIPPNSIDLSKNSNVTIIGDLALQQRRPIQSSGADTIYNKSIIDLNNFFATSTIDLNPILDEYFSRYYYTTFEPQYTRWKPDSTTANNVLTVNVIVNIPKQLIRFIPGFWQEFKWGWIQYVCVLLPFIIVFSRIKEYVFRNQIVKTLVELPQHRHKD